MSTRIADGTGKTAFARVDASNHLHTRGVVRSEVNLAAQEGRAFQCGTTTVALTSANDSAIYYFKNNEEVDIIIDEIAINSSAHATSGTDDYLIFSFTADPTSISATNAAACADVRIGDTTVPDVTHYTGAEAATFTGGTSIPLAASLEVNRFHTLKSQVALPKGKAIGISVEPPTGTTGLNVTVALRVYLAPTDDL
jgi:hypothetical protein